MFTYEISLTTSGSFSIKLLLDKLETIRDAIPFPIKLLALIRAVVFVW
jgi:hypothetical protein